MAIMYRHQSSYGLGQKKKVADEVPVVPTPAVKGELPTLDSLQGSFAIREALETRHKQPFQPLSKVEELKLDVLTELMEAGVPIPGFKLPEISTLDTGVKGETWRPDEDSEVSISAVPDDYVSGRIPFEDLPSSEVDWRPFFERAYVANPEFDPFLGLFPDFSDPKYNQPGLLPPDYKKGLTSFERVIGNAPFAGLRDAGNILLDVISGAVELSSRTIGNIIKNVFMSTVERESQDVIDVMFPFLTSEDKKNLGYKTPEFIDSYAAKWVSDVALSAQQTIGAAGAVILAWKVLPLAFRTLFPAWFMAERIGGKFEDTMTDFEETLLTIMDQDDATIVIDDSGPPPGPEEVEEESPSEEPGVGPPVDTSALDDRIDRLEELIDLMGGIDMGAFEYEPPVINVPRVTVPVPIIQYLEKAIPEGLVVSEPGGGGSGRPRQAPTVPNYCKVIVESALRGEEIDVPSECVPLYEWVQQQEKVMEVKAKPLASSKRPRRGKRANRVDFDKTT